MKKKVFRKGVALAVAFGLIMSLGAVSIVAANDATDSAKLNDNRTGTESSSEIVQIVKNIKGINPNSTTVYAPNITYTYTLGAGTAGRTILDGTEDSRTKAGVTQNVILRSTTDDGSTTSDSTTGELVADLTYKPGNAANFNTTPDGASNAQYIYVDFSGVNFEEPGIYRYTLTEYVLNDGSNSNRGTSNTYNATGVTEAPGSNAHVRYLDVYVKTNDNYAEDNTSAAQFDVYGYALLTSDVGVTNTNESNYKATGFLDDSYTTYDLTISKTVENDAYTVAKKTQFPFTVTLENSSVTANVTLGLSETTGNNLVTAAAPTAGALSSTELKPAIASGGSVTYTGIPADTTVSIIEKNTVDSTATYKVTTTGADTNINGKSVAYNESTSAATVKMNGAETVGVTNHLENISPTGVILRFAPYLILLGIGIFLLVFARRRHAAKKA